MAEWSKGVWLKFLIQIPKGFVGSNPTFVKNDLFGPWT